VTPELQKGVVADEGRAVEELLGAHSRKATVVGGFQTRPRTARKKLKKKKEKVLLLGQMGEMHCHLN